MSASHKLTQSILVLLFLIASASVAWAADPDLEKLAPTTAIAGNDINYRIALSTAAGSPLSSVTVSDALPVGTDFISSAVTQAGWTITPPAIGANGTITFSKGVVNA